MKFHFLIFYLTGIIFTVTNCTETTVVDTKPPAVNPNLPNSTFTSIQQKVVHQFAISRAAMAIQITRQIYT